MRALITLEPYARSINPYDLLARINCGQIVECGRNKCIIDLSDCDTNILTMLRDINYVGHISIIDQIISRDLDTLFVVAKETLLGLIGNGDGTFKVVVRRMDKKYPVTSIELAKKLGEYLAQFARVDLEDPDYIVYVEVRDDSFIVAHSTRDLFRKRRETIPSDWVNRVVGIVDGPKEVYEAMDLVQLSHALGIEIRLITNPLIVDRAFRALRLGSLPRVRIVNIDEALNGIDIPIVLSMHANYNERKLIEVSREAFSKGLRIGLILGNEYDDVSLNLRGRAMYEIRLGPMTGHPMRTTIALAYGISVIYTTWLMNQ
ncbi:MAG: THUMP domain-containing protein [Vulcanisaeta sp.]|jgi:tRNA(Ser,Leu) C12 N-acetylase TAN1|uniref:THUMP domain-containing protein n=1 Tax=Vulcanisaeta sp. TaxID=2020871 RepID=UPI003D10DDAC